MAKCTRVPAHVSLSTNFTINQIRNNIEEPNKSPLDGVWQPPPRWRVAKDLATVTKLHFFVKLYDVQLMAQCEWSLNKYNNQAIKTVCKRLKLRPAATALKRFSQQTDHFSSDY